MELEVTNGVVLIDEADYDFLSEFSWNINPNGYVQTSVWDKDLKKLNCIKMHQLLMGRKDGKIIDHINRDKLDNRKENLRFVTRSQNWYNSDRADKFYQAGRLTNPKKYVRYGKPQALPIAA